MNYSLLRWRIRRKADRGRVARNLLKLRAQLDRDVPAKDSEDHLLLATWNIRDFGKPGSRRGWGKRLPETWFYIAEVLSRFDFVAVQEVNELREWETVMDILGREWDYIATDETDRSLGGNGERMVFAWDRRKVWFQNVAGEIVLPPQMLISRAELDVEDETVVAGSQFKRTPFLASFQAGWLKFDICTVHLYYGSAAGSKLQHRIEEIYTIAKYLSTRADRALGEDRALIVLGDFNIVSPEHDTMMALLDHGFVIPDALKRNPTTRTRKHYDQIGFKTRPEVLQFIEGDGNAGVVKLFEKLFTTSSFEDYRDSVLATSKGRRARTREVELEVYRDWRTYQFSDHYPMWVRLQTDSSTDYLERLASGQ